MLHNRIVLRGLVWSACLFVSWPALAETIAVNVQVNAAAIRNVMSPLGLGMHTSPYYNEMGNGNLDDRIEAAGVTTLRAGGGGYADVYHWSITQAAWDSGITEGGGCCGGGLTPWFGNPNDFGYVGGGSDFAGFVNLLDRVDNGHAVVTVNYGSALKLQPDASNPSGVASVVPDFGGQPKEAAAWVAYANSDASIYGTPQDIVIGVDQQGNDWKTAGYWARLRASTQSEYENWSQNDGLYDPLNSFLAINRGEPIGIKYWEIGNETFGAGYYDTNSNGYSVNYDLAYPHSSHTRSGDENLSPAHYGEEVVEYSQLMKSIDPTIKIGAVLSTPPDDWNWDYWPRSGGPNNPNNKHWNPEVLEQAAGDIDFVMVHWYPYIGEAYTDLNNNQNHDPGEPVNDGGSLLAFPRQKIQQMIDGTTPGVDSGANAGVRDWLATYGIPDAEIMVTEFNYFGEVWEGGFNNLNDYRTAADALFVADSYSSWLELGVTSVHYLELLGKQFLSDSGNLQRGPAYYGVSLVDKLVKPGEEFIDAGSDHADVRSHAVVQDDGSIAIMLINMALDDVANVTVNVSGANLGGDGIVYELLGGSGIAESVVSGLSSSFDVFVQPRSAVVYVIAPAVVVPGDYNGDGVVDAVDYAMWRENLGGPADMLANNVDGDPIGAEHFNTWKQAYGSSAASASGFDRESLNTRAPEPASGVLLLLAALLFCLRTSDPQSF